MALRLRTLTPTVYMAAVVESTAFLADMRLGAPPVKLTHPTKLPMIIFMHKLCPASQLTLKKAFAAQSAMAIIT